MCSKRRKQWPRFKLSKSQTPALIAVIVAFCCIVFLLAQNQSLQQENAELRHNVSGLSATIEQLNTTTGSQLTTIEQLNEQIAENDKTQERLLKRIDELSETANLIDKDLARDLVFVLSSDPALYHKSKCILFKTRVEFGSDSFCAYSISDATANGCRPGECCY